MSDFTKKIIQFIVGTIFIALGIYVGIHFWPLSEIIAIALGGLSIATGFSVWFPQMIKEIFDGFTDCF